MRSGRAGGRMHFDISVMTLDVWEVGFVKVHLDGDSGSVRHGNAGEPDSC